MDTYAVLRFHLPLYC